MLKTIKRRIMELTIRQETKSDFPHVYEVNELAFQQATEARLVDLLRKSNAFIPQLSLVAVIANRVIGHILFTRITIIDDNRIGHNSLALAPMAVRPDFQRQGIGGQLVTRGLQTATELGHRSVIVVGHEDYYPRFGFEPAGKWKIKCPYDDPLNVFMAVELVENGLKNVAGIVQYPKEFDEV